MVTLSDSESRGEAGDSEELPVQLQVDDVVQAQVTVPLAIDESDSEDISKLDLISLLQCNLKDEGLGDDWKAGNNDNRIDAEIIRRFDELILMLVSETDKDTLVDLMEENGAGFTGYQVLKLIYPSCDVLSPPRARRVLTLMAPKGHSERFLDFFALKGYRRTQIDGATMELRAERYGDAAYSCVNLLSIAMGVFVDVIESANHLACYPIFRMVATSLMHFISPTRIFAPYGRLTCENQGIINPYHSEDKYGVSLPTDLLLEIKMLKLACNGITLHRNPACLPGNDHEDFCGVHPECLSTLRSSASEDSIVYSFRDPGKHAPDPASSPTFFSVDGILWRLGGWGCYPSSPGMRPYLAEAPALHARYEGQVKGQAVGIEYNLLARNTIGWSTNQL